VACGVLMAMRKIGRRRNRAKPGPTVLTNALMALMTEEHTISDCSHPLVSRVGRISTLIGDDVMRVLEALVQTYAAVCAEITLPESGLLCCSGIKTERSLS